MSEAKHTPRPWSKSGVRVKINGELFLQVLGAKGVVAYIPYGDGGIDDHIQSRADQSCISAAPDLLGALKALRDPRYAVNCWCSVPERDGHEDECMAARAAIDKAEGNNAKR